MRHPLAEYRQQVHRGVAMPRALPTAVTMLIIVAILMTNARNPAIWRFFGEERKNGPGLKVVAAEVVPEDASGEAKTGTAEEKTAEGKAEEAEKLVPTGPIETDFEEREFMDEIVREQIVEDGTLRMNEAEMTAYYHVLDWVRNQPLALLRQRAEKNVVYDQFVAKPDAMRFKPYELEIEVRQIVPIQDVEGLEGQKLYEVWGFSKDSGALLYTATVMNLPEGMPIGPDIQERAKLVGYFFKLQGYYSRLSPPDMPGEKGKKGRSRLLKAPALVGRLVWIPADKVAQTEPIPPWIWMLAAGALVVVIGGGVVLTSIWSRRTPPMRPLILHPRSGDPDAVSVDDWLDQNQ